MWPNMPDEQTRLILSKAWAADALARRAERSAPGYQECQLPLALPMAAPGHDVTRDPQVMLRK